MTQGRNDLPNKAETTHLKNWLKRPRPKRSGRNDSVTKRPGFLHSCDLLTFRHLDDSALDVSAPRRFGPRLVNSPRRFRTRTFRHQGVSASDKWMDGRTYGLAVELPIKFKFFTTCYGSKRLYVLAQKNEHFARISLCIRAVTRASVSHLFFYFFFFSSRRDGLFIAPRVGILAPVDSTSFLRYHTGRNHKHERRHQVNFKKDSWQFLGCAVNSG